MPVNFDKEYVQRLRRIARELGIKFSVRKDGLADPAYIEELRKKYPLTSTPDQRTYALDIRDGTGVPLSLAEFSSFTRCSNYISANKEAFYKGRPSKKQQTCARDLAKRHGVPLPRKVLLNREECKAWMESFRAIDLGQVHDILARRNLTSLQIQEECSREGFYGLWDRCVEYVNWVIATHGHLLHDRKADYDARCKVAEEKLRRGDGNPYSVGEEYDLDDNTMIEIVKKVEADGDLDLITY